MSDPLVALRNIRKSFGAVEVLHGVDFAVLPGEVHVLAGENGAGKSTLIRILAGVYDDFTGDLLVEGRARRFSRPQDAVRAGIATIHQELSLVPSMTVADNLFLGRERCGPAGWMDFGTQETAASRILDEMAIEASPHQFVAELPLAQQQMLEIARALEGEARVLVLDEPTSALQEHEVASLFTRLRELRARGRGIVYITHRMDEIYRLADRITVLRDGRVVGTAPRDDLPPNDLVRWMVGREPEAPSARSPVSSAAPALHIEGLRVTDAERPERMVVDDLAFTLRSGEVLGLAGLQGSGASAALHALSGALGTRATWRGRLDGEPYAPRTPGEAAARGVMLLTNDRKGSGLVPDRSVTENVSLASLSRFSNAAGWVRRGQERAAVRDLVVGFRLAATALDEPVRTLSGGNQQKAYLARCLLPAPRILLLDEPTRGIDVGAKADIYELMRDWTRQGIGILLITSEMEELLALSDRILVLSRGRMAAELAGGTASKERILAAAMGQPDTAEDA